MLAIKKWVGYFIFDEWVIECSLMEKKKFYGKIFFKESVNCLMKEIGFFVFFCVCSECSA